MAPSRLADQVGRVFDGRYRLLAPIGAGGSAAVYSADDIRLRRRVAIKVLHDELASDDRFLRRFRAEAQAVAALNHRNILQVYDSGEEDGNAYLVMELLGGGSLRSILDRGARLTPSQAVQVGLDAARALDYAHRRGLVHRDIKPANLLFDEEGRVCIADFGLARALAEASVTEPTGAILGTFRYASPEQALGKSVDGKADVYALALVLVEAVTGQVPFAADTPVATLMARVNNALEPPAALGALGPVLEQAGIPNPDDRIDAAGLVAGLERVGRTMAAPPPLPLAGTREIDDQTRVVDDITVIPPVGVGSAPLFDGDAPSDVAARRAPRPPRSARTDAASTAEWDFAAVAAGGAAEGEGRRGRRRARARSGRRRRWPWVAVLLLVLAVAGAGGAFALAGATKPSHPVPTLTAKQLADARRAVVADHFKIKVVGDKFTGDDDIAPGTILEQSPLAGVKLKEDHTISVVVSKGPSPRPVPDLTGDEAAARQKLAAASLAVDEPNIQRPFSEDVPKGQVMDWSPKGVDVAKGTAVKLTVSAGPQPRTISDWRGKSFDEAAAAFKTARLVAQRNDVFDDTVPAGQIVSTSPPANSTAPRDSTVVVNVSKGPDLVQVPDVGGKSVADATAAMRAAGLSVANVFGPPDKKVFTTDPPAGTKVKRGSAVNLYTK